jgi:hypothetical protein
VIIFVFCGVYADLIRCSLMCCDGDRCKVAADVELLAPSLAGHTHSGVTAPWKSLDVARLYDGLGTAWNTANDVISAVPRPKLGLTTALWSLLGSAVGADMLSAITSVVVTVPWVCAGRILIPAFLPLLLFRLLLYLCGGFYLFGSLGFGQRIGSGVLSGLLLCYYVYKPFYSALVVVLQPLLFWAKLHGVVYLLLMLNMVCYPRLCWPIVVGRRSFNFRPVVLYILYPGLCLTAGSYAACLKNSASLMDVNLMDTSYVNPVQAHVRTIVSIYRNALFGA